ncbi:hypothetical protein ACF064_20780 [Streptomyces sp. NPDC015492]|uniref:hypothetical protein n=1 Tax=Streptomyces sp. NPDC015492 TaxID=3364958 RepID=UPI0036F70794
MPQPGRLGAALETAHQKQVAAEVADDLRSAASSGRPGWHGPPRSADPRPADARPGPGPTGPESVPRTTPPRPAGTPGLTR